MIIRGPYAREEWRGLTYFLAQTRSLRLLSLLLTMLLYNPVRHRIHARLLKQTQHGTRKKRNVSLDGLTSRIFCVPTDIFYDRSYLLSARRNNSRMRDSANKYSSSGDLWAIPCSTSSNTFLFRPGDVWV
jgi:hypothetical protein